MRTMYINKYIPFILLVLNGCGKEENKQGEKINIHQDSSFHSLLSSNLNPANTTTSAMENIPSSDIGADVCRGYVVNNSQNLPLCTEETAGEVYVSAEEEAVYRCQNHSWELLFLAEEGIEGETGIPAEPGKHCFSTTGDTNKDGFLNVQDCVGPAGKQGDIGKKGLLGLRGATGPKGDPGPKGYSGERGILGPTGDQGDVGETGPQGDTGVPGPMGLPGPKGQDCACPSI